MLDQHEAARELMDRFPGWKVWLGTQTRRWWAMAPNDLRLSRLLQSETLGGLAAQIVEHVEPTKAKAKGQTERPQARFCWRLDEGPQPVRLARRMVQEALAAWSALHWLEDARVVVSELVTNAGKHAAPPIVLTLSIESDQGTGRRVLVVAVTDGSRTLPAEREPGEDGGFGMTVLLGLATVTTHLHEGGKTVRAVIREPPRR